MRLIYQILLGMLLLNMMLVLFSGFFPSSSVYADDATNVTADYSEYENPGDVFSVLFPSESFSKNVEMYAPAFLIVTVIALASGVIGYGLGGGASSAALGLGIGLFISFIGLLWTRFYSVISNISPDNYIVTGIVNVTTIGIGIIIAYTMIEFLVGQRGVEQ